MGKISKIGVLIIVKFWAPECFWGGVGGMWGRILPTEECALRLVHSLYLRKGCCRNPGPGRGPQHSQKGAWALEILAAGTR